MSLHQVSDVASHSKIDLDIQEIKTAVGQSDWATAKQIYEGGKNSKKPDGTVRNLKSFSTSFSTAGASQAEPLAQLGKAYWGRYDYGNAMVTAALTGQDDAQFGNYATGSLAKKADARSQVIEKGIQFSAVWQYALHEMESALAKYKEGKYDVAKGAPYYLDEAWAFYAGSLETGGATGVSTYIAAEKQGPKFGTQGYQTGTAGRSRVTMELLYQFNAMQRYLQTPGNDEAIANIAKCVRAQWKVPLIQGCLYYAHASSSAKITDSEGLTKIKAEAWAYCVPILPSLNEADPASAQLVQDAVSISSDKRPDWEVVKKAFSTQNLNKMGVMCEDIGYLGSNGFNAATYAESSPLTLAERTNCKDDNALIRANAFADSTKCATVKMPRCGNGVVCSASAYLLPSQILALLALSCVSFFFARH